MKALVAALLLGMTASVLAQGQSSWKRLRNDMVDASIVREGVENPRVLKAMRSVPRHEFVLPKYRRDAYVDGALPIGHKQTISPPFIVAYMTEVLDPQPEDRILEIGTGSGYQAAVLAEIVDHVYTIEIVKPLSLAAKRRLRRLKYENVSTLAGDGYKGWEEHAPFDKIIVTCSPEKVPDPLVEQLKEGGKMIVPLGERYQQTFYLFEKKDGELVRERLIPTLFVPMTGRSEELREVLPDPRRPSVVNGGFEIDTDEDGRTDHWHYQRLTERMSEDAPVGRHFQQFRSQEPGRAAHALQGMAIDGRHVGHLSVSVRIRKDDIRAGARQYEKAGLYLHLYDGLRQPLGTIMVGPWAGTADWKLVDKRITIPKATREAILRIGLNGATGTLDVDDVHIAAED